MSTLHEHRMMYVQCLIVVDYSHIHVLKGERLSLLTLSSFDVCTYKMVCNIQTSFETNYAPSMQLSQV